MKIAVISDTHLGYGTGTEREEDPFRQAEEAVDRALEMDVDLILLPGDIFDNKTPTLETWSWTLKILKKPLMKENKKVEVIEPEKGKNKLSKSGVPIVAIHGTHERRSKGYVNPIQMLEDAGYLIHLNCEKAVVKVNGEKVAIHGMSGVPETHAKTVLEKYDPKPVEGVPNIFVFHQSLEEYVYDPNNTFLKVNDLPPGFDLYIDGHIHWRNILENGRTVLFPGSTITTQMKKIEAEKNKGFYVVDTGTWDKEFIRLEKQRPFKYIEVEFDGESGSEIVKRAREKLKNSLEEEETNIPSLVKLKLKGKVARGTEASISPGDQIKEDFDALIHIDKEYESEGFKQKIESLRESQRNKKSIREMGMDALRELLEDSEYDSINLDEIIPLLTSKDPSEVVGEIMDKRKGDRKEEKEEEEEKDRGSSVKKLSEF